MKEDEILGILSGASKPAEKLEKSRSRQTVNHVRNECSRLAGPVKKKR